MTVRTEINSHEDGRDHRARDNTDEEDGWSLSDAMPLEGEALRMGIARGEKLGRMEGLEMGVESGRKAGEEMASEMGFYRGVAVALLTLNTVEEATKPVVSSCRIDCGDDTNDEAAVVVEDIMGPVVDQSLITGKEIHSPGYSGDKVKLIADEGSCEGDDAGMKRREDDLGKFLVVSERARKSLRMVCQLAVSTIPKEGEEEEVTGDTDMITGLETCRRKFRAVMSMLRCPIRYEREAGKSQDQTLSF